MVIRLALVLLTLIGSAAARPAEAVTLSRTVYVSVTWGVPPAGFLAWTTVQGTQAWIVVSPSAPSTFLTPLMAHELGHAAGLGHEADPVCAMAYPVSPVLAICPQEVARLLALGNRCLVSVPDPVLRTATQAAGRAWNRASGYKVYAVP